MSIPNKKFSYEPDFSVSSYTQVNTDEELLSYDKKVSKKNQALSSYLKSRIILGYLENLRKVLVRFDQEFRSGKTLYRVRSK